MAPRPLGRSGLQAAPLALGGNVFGWTADEKTSFAVLDAFQCGCLHRARVQVALHPCVRRACRSELVLRRRPDAFGEGAQRQRVRRVDDGPDDGFALFAAADVETKLPDRVSINLLTEAIDGSILHPCLVT
jgi:hypothetical protein